jgi:hypothetical protein
MIACPPGFDCQVLCTGPESCQGATILCPDVYSCTVDCGGAQGPQACGNAKVQCSSNGVCFLDCTGPLTCQGVDVTCGNNACTANCSNLATSPTVACGTACGCNHC